MTRKLKPVALSLDPEIQGAVRGLPVQDGDRVTTVGSLLKEAERCLRLANHAVGENALAQATADLLMRQQKRRGEAKIQARIDGEVVLVVSYGGDPPDQQEVPSPPKSLPGLDELRKIAAEREVDISDLGRQKRKIMARLGVPR